MARSQQRLSSAGSTVWPPIEGNEPIDGYLWRGVVHSSRSRMKGLVQHVVGRQAIQPPWIVPCNLEQICERLAPVFGSAQQLFDGHTLLPAHLPFVAEHARATLLDHVFKGERSPGIAAVAGLTGRAITSKPRMALCPICVREDLLAGFPIWRRQHQLAGFGVCPFHDVELVAGCGRCHYSQPGSRQPQLPERNCWCGQPHQRAYPPQAPAHRKLLARLARSADALLAGALANRTPTEIGAYYHLCAQESGFADGTRVKSPALVEQLRRAYPQEVLSRLNAALDKGQNWAAVCLGKKVAPNVLGRNLLLFDFFGQRIPAQSEFERARLHAQELAAHQAARRPQVSPASPDRRQRNRAVLEAFRRAHPQATRAAAIKAHPGAVLWVREHDAPWYEQAFPSARRGGDRLGDQGRQRYWAEWDERTAAHCRQRQADLLAGKGQPKQITKSVLLKGCARANELAGDLLANLPLTRAALAAGVESRPEFQRRFALWILRQPDPLGLDRVGLAARKTGLRIDEVDALHFTLIHEERK
ncbi:TniQ family protein [Ramlibacter tataouinensis]|uniref:TniQ family protein n=1 Tax=Ramlibacter tataouinensis TaxID=94132 RepID=UPI0022F3D889|nr:TniQ family protein [Ramlibacter tataouinensis]WBY03589.1 TniQ family protein [Ramlibacter tataouinensis]